MKPDGSIIDLVIGTGKEGEEKEQRTERKYLGGSSIPREGGGV